LPTFLTTPKMSPELAARVNASVSGKARGQKRSVVRALLGLAVLVTVALAIGSIAVSRTRQSDALESRRTRLLESFRERSASVAELDRRMLDRSMDLLLTLSAPYEGDLVSPKLRNKEQLGATLAQPTIYLRAPIEGFDDLQSLRAASEASFPDGSFHV